MKKRFTEAQIVGFLREADAGVPVKDLCRKHGFSDASYYLWSRRSTRHWPHVIRPPAGAARSARACSRAAAFRRAQCVADSANPLLLPTLSCRLAAPCRLDRRLRPSLEEGTLTKEQVTVTITRVLSIAAALTAIAVGTAVAQGPDPLLGTLQAERGEIEGTFHERNDRVQGGPADTLKGTRRPGRH